MPHHRVELARSPAAARRRSRRCRRSPTPAPTRCARSHMLVAPVQALLVGAGVVDEADLAARVADLRVGERARRDARARRGSQIALASEKASSSPLAGRAPRRPARGILPPRGSSSTRSAPAARARCAVTSAPGSPPPSTATISSSRVARPVERQRVGDLGGDHGLLAVGGDDQRHPRAHAVGRRRAERRSPAVAAAAARNRP